MDEQDGADGALAGGPCTETASTGPSRCGACVRPGRRHHARPDDDPRTLLEALLAIVTAVAVLVGALRSDGEAEAHGRGMKGSWPPAMARWPLTLAPSPCRRRPRWPHEGKCSRGTACNGVEPERVDVGRSVDVGACRGYGRRVRGQWRTLSALPSLASMRLC